MRGDSVTSQLRPQLEKSEQFSHPSLKGTWDGAAELCLTSLPCSPVGFTQHVLLCHPSYPGSRVVFAEEVLKAYVSSVLVAQIYPWAIVVALCLMNLVGMSSVLS